MNHKIFLILLFCALLFSCSENKTLDSVCNVRPPADTIGFATKGWQVDSLISRMNFPFNAEIKNSENWKTLISPHDDYGYVNDLYLKTLNNLNAKTIIIFGVAHKARNFELQDKLIFDSFDYWQGVYGKIKVSGLRERLTQRLPENMFVVHDTMQTVEHSVEALLPYLQNKNRNIEIVSILVPYMQLERMAEISSEFSKALGEIAKSNNLKWGRDFAIAISSDAVHYGDEDWGGSNYARFGADKKGYGLATDFELEIINNCLVGEITKPKIEKFFNYTVKEDNYKEYKWTWCGRYSIPFGLFTTLNLQENMGCVPKGELIGYSTSIEKEPLQVQDIGMGLTAPANIRHWVGYASVGYK